MFIAISHAIHDLILYVILVVFTPSTLYFLLNSVAIFIVSFLCNFGRDPGPG